MNKSKSGRAIESEAAFAADLYRDRAALNSKAQELLATGSRQVTIRLNNSELARAKQQSEAKGLRDQTYVKVLLHEALAWNGSGGR